MICYRDIPYGDVAIIKDVWERNRAFHEKISQYFGDLYSELVFEKRIKGFEAFDAEKIKITVAEESEGGAVLACCISTFEGRFGEPHTLHVVEEVRGMGIGKELMRRHVEWLKVNKCGAITVTVACENSKTIAFYESLGFMPNTLQMRLK